VRPPSHLRVQLCWVRITFLIQIRFCYGYSIYISYITYPIIPTQTFVIKSPSLYLFLTYPFRSCFTINTKKPFFYLLAFFRYFRVKDQHPQTYRIEHSNLYLNTFLKWQVHLKHFRCLRTALSHYINISSLEMDYYIPIT